MLSLVCLISISVLILSQIDIGCTDT